MASSTIAMIIVAVAIVLFVTELIPLPVTALAAALAMSIFGVITYKEAFAGFANDVPMMLIGACILGDALFQTGAAKKLGNAIIKVVGTNERIFVLVIFILAGVLSSFLSNTAVVAAMLPMIAAASAASGGKITKKNTYMAVGIAANMGGSLTLVGSTTNMVGQALLAETGQPTMAFFDLTLLSLPRFLIVGVAFATVGYNLQKKVFNFPEKVTQLTNTEQVEDPKKESPLRMWTSVAILILTVLGYYFGIWTMGTVSMVAALLCIVTKCISIEDAYKAVDWNTIWITAGSLGFALGLEKSGAGQLIADTVIGWFGGAPSMFLLLILFSVLSVVMANFMSSTGTMSILGSIGIFMFRSLGYDTKSIIMALIVCINLAFATPIGTAPVTLTLSGGYRFTDYVKVGGVMVVVGLAATIATYPFFYGFG